MNSTAARRLNSALCCATKVLIPSASSEVRTISFASGVRATNAETRPEKRQRTYAAVQLGDTTRCTFRALSLILIRDSNHAHVLNALAEVEDVSFELGGGNLVRADFDQSEGARTRSARCKSSPWVGYRSLLHPIDNIESTLRINQALIPRVVEALGVESSGSGFIVSQVCGGTAASVLRAHTH